MSDKENSLVNLVVDELAEGLTQRKRLIFAAIIRHVANLSKASYGSIPDDVSALIDRLEGTATVLTTHPDFTVAEDSAKEAPW